MIVVGTHAWYWWVTANPALSSTARGRLNREREVTVPAICLWEVAMMAARGRIDVGPDVDSFLDEALAWEGVRVQPVSTAVAVRAATLSRLHRIDPADQLIAATAMELNVPMVTSDARLQGLAGLRTVW